MLKEKPTVKSKVEAILFSIGHRISLDEISRLSRSIKEDVLSAIKELQKEYEDKHSSLMLVEEGELWKFTVRDHFIPMVRKIVTETELTKSVLETLAVISFKYPILQSDLIKIRTNKAYEHLVELEKSGYISRQKQGRTNLIKLTEKFFKYFDLTEENLKEKFKDFESIAKAIKEKEEEVDKIKEEQLKKAEDLKKEDERIKKEIESLDESEEEFEISLETYEAKSKELITGDAQTEFGTTNRGFEKEGNLIVEKEKIGELEVVDEQKESSEKVISKIQDNKQIQIQEKEETKQIFEQEKKSQLKKQRKKDEVGGIKLTPEMEKIVDEKVEKILGNEDKPSIED